MSKAPLTKNFYLLSFIPAFAYWYLEETQTLQIAVIGGLSLAILEVLIEKIFTKHVHSLSKLNLFILAILGPISLIGEDGLWFKLQPFFTGVFLFSYLTYNINKGQSLMHTMSEDLKMKKSLPKDMLIQLEKHLSYFLLVFGFFMAYLAKFESTSMWAFFKTIGFYLAFFVFLIGEMFFLRNKIKQDLGQELIAEVAAKLSSED